MNPEPALKHPQFFSGEICRISLLGDGLLRVFFRNTAWIVLPGSEHCRTGEKSQACQQWQSGLTQELTHERWS